MLTRLFIFLVPVVLLLLLLGIGLLTGVFIPNTSVQDEQPTGTTFVSQENNLQQITPLPPNSIASRSNQTYSAETLLASESTNQVTQAGLFESSSDSDWYSLGYFEPNGNISIILYQEPLTLARQLAQEQLQQLMPYDEAALCDMDISVLVNQAVNPNFASTNLGLSFCPGAIDLP